MPELQVVQTLTAGVDNVWPHLPAGATLCNARGVHDASTAELVVGLIIASLRRIPEFVAGAGDGRVAARPLRGARRQDRPDRRLRRGRRGDRAPARRVRGRRRCASRAAPATASRRSPTSHALLPQADVVVVVCPLTDETRGLIDSAFLGRMKQGALLVNASRGPVAVTDDLLAAAARPSHVRLALDVTDPEPLPADHPLWRAPGVLISPHVGGNSTAFLPRAYRLVAAQLHRFVAGEPLENVMARPGADGVRTRSAVLRVGRCADAVRGEPPARHRGRRARAAGRGRGARRGQGRRAVPLRPVGRQRRPSAPDADGARPRGRRRGARGRRRRARRQASATTSSWCSCRRAGCACRAARVARRCASPARSATPRARCSPASAGSPTPTASELHHHLGCSAFAELRRRVASARSSRSTTTCRGTRRRCSAARCSPASVPSSTPRRCGSASRSPSSASAASGSTRCSAALASGARDVVAVDTLQDKLDLARELGATHTVLAGPDAADEIRDLTSGGVDVAVEMAGSVHAFETAYRATRRGGTTVTGGLPQPERDVVGVAGAPRRRGTHDQGLVHRLGACRGATSRATSSCSAPATCRSTSCSATHVALDDINAALDHLDSGHALRQVVMTDA